SQVYDQTYSRYAEKCAKDLGIGIQQGVYVGNTGPTYETPAEIKMLRTLGGDAVGMSTVPEVTVAAHAGIRVLGISCISNMAAGRLDQPLRQSAVIQRSGRVRGDLLRFIKKIIPTRPQQSNEGIRT